jgi:hypothetical protein
LERKCTYKGVSYDNAFSRFSIKDTFYRHIPWVPFGRAALARAWHYFVAKADELENPEMKCFGYFEILQQKTLPEYHIWQMGSFIYPIGFGNVDRTVGSYNNY